MPKNNYLFKQGKIIIKLNGLIHHALFSKQNELHKKCFINLFSFFFIEMIDSNII